MKKYILIYLVILVIAIGCSKITDTDSDKKEWTFMWYLDGDEVSMQQDFIAAFHNIIAANVGSTDEVNIVIQFDRYPHMDDFGGWENAQRFFYTAGLEPTPQNAIQNWGDGEGGREVNMADPEVLQAFIQWAIAKYPAEHYALMLADHGYGWQGMMVDMTSEGDFMSVKGMVNALENSKVKLDLLCLNACVMQGLEVMHELQQLPVDIVVGSENLGTVWPFTQLLQTITANPAITAADLGNDICDQYYNINPADTNLTLSTIQLDEIPQVNAALADFCNTILDSSSFDQIQPKAQQILDALETAVLYKRNGSAMENVGGLSIYWPPMKQGYMPTIFFYSYIDEIISFAADNPWRDFLYVYYNMFEYPNIIPGELYQIYGNLTFFDDDKVDLYEFCQKIVNY